MSPRASWLTLAAAAVLGLAAALLGVVGFRSVLDTTDGRAVDPELDPDEPGYEAFLDPTPVALLVGTNEAGALSWCTVVVLGGVDAAGGAVLFLPPGALAEAPDLGVVPLATAFEQAGFGPFEQAVADLVGAGFSEVEYVSPARAVDLFAPVAPLSITLPDDLPGLDAGPVELTAEDAARLLLFVADGESDLNRMARHELVWRAWLEAVAGSTDPDVVPGEAASGVGRYVRGLAAGQATFDLVPVTPVPLGGGAELYEPDPDAMADLVADRIPFPVGSHPGARPLVRVLDGVGADGLALAVGRDAVRAGAQVTVLGNADRFDVEASRVVYFDGSLVDEARALARELGVESVQQLEGPNPNDLVDLTIVVGSDLAGAYGLAPRTAEAGATGGDDPG